MSFTTRPFLRGHGGAVAAGHYLATQIGAQVLAEDGNAADAACAMGFALAVLEPTQNGLGARYRSWYGTPAPRARTAWQDRAAHPRRPPSIGCATRDSH